MIIFKKAEDISSFLASQRGNKRLGFVPTMGALHRGHTALIDQCKKQNDIAVCSIFVNPSQFNNLEDFKLYPITVEKDIQQLTVAGCHVLFLPPIQEIYPLGYQKRVYNLGKIETILEGQYRPGHFQGVCQVVDRLLEIINPHRLYMGQKDYQQCMVIKRLLELLGKENTCQMIVEPTIRESDGLAMSSRNMRLTNDDRKKAAAISKTLRYIKDSLPLASIEDLKVTAKEMLENETFKVDYVEIADANSLEPATTKTTKLVALIAATIGNVRLIDNMLLN